MLPLSAHADLDEQKRVSDAESATVTRQGDGASLVKQHNHFTTPAPKGQAKLGWRAAIGAIGSLQVQVHGRSTPRVVHFAA